MEVFTSNGERILLEDKPFASGGEGELRKVLYKNGLCAKLYHKRIKERESKIQYMIKNPPQQIKTVGFQICWPLYCIYMGDGFVGFIMNLAYKHSVELVNLTPLKISNKLDYDFHYRFDRKTPYSFLCRMKLVKNIAIPVYILHSTEKYVFKDFKPQNVLVTYDGLVSITDIDSIQISDGNRLLYPATVSTQEYRPPEYYKDNVGKNSNEKLEKSWDLFSIAVVFYEILFGIHPYVGTLKGNQDSNSTISASISLNYLPIRDGEKYETIPLPHEKFKSLPKDIQKLFLKAFSDNRYIRQPMEDWGKIFQKYINEIEPKIPIPPKQIPVPKPTPKPTPKPQVPTPQGKDGCFSVVLVVCVMILVIKVLLAIYL